MKYASIRFMLASILLLPTFLSVGQLLINDSLTLSKEFKADANQLAVARILLTSYDGEKESKFLFENHPELNNRLNNNDPNIHFSMEINVIPSVQTIIEGSPYNSGLLNVRNLVPISRLGKIGILPIFGRK